jgi:hypothetical protein
MDRTVIDETTLTSLGNAIREKTGKTDLIGPTSMPSEIDGIVVASPYEWQASIILIIYDDYTVSGPVLRMYGKTLSYVYCRCTTVDSLVGYTDYLPSGGTATLNCKTTVYEALTDSQKSAITGKGYTLIGTLS